MSNFEKIKRHQPLIGFNLKNARVGNRNNAGKGIIGGLFTAAPFDNTYTIGWNRHSAKKTCPLLPNAADVVHLAPKIFPQSAVIGINKFFEIVGKRTTNCFVKALHVDYVAYTGTVCESPL